MEKSLLTEMAYGFSPTAVKITKAELIDKINKLQGKDIPTKFTSIVDATYKKKNPLGVIYKVSQVEGLLNSDYATKKQEKLNIASPGEIHVPGRTYGTHTSSSIIEHAGKHYVQVLPQSSASQRFVVKSNIGTFSEKTKEECKDYLAPSRPTGDMEVVLRRYGIGSIVAIELEGVSYEISDVDTDRHAALDIVNAGLGTQHQIPQTSTPAE